jgi:hypothetical protein
MPEITLVPMIRVQRDLYRIPRGPGRFRSYLDAMTGGTNDIVLPLSVFNPMGRDHVADHLDALIRLDAEAVAVDAIREAKRRLGGLEATFRLGLVVADDLGGGWTSRPHVEIENRFRPWALLKRGWAVGLSWTGDVPTGEGIRGEVLATIYRTISILRFGEARSLGQMMRQEGLAAVFAGAATKALDAEEIAYSREVIRPNLEATDLTTILPCLFGDRAARAVGNDAFGLTDRAGFLLATAEALEGGTTPEEALRVESSRVVNP